jgi:Ca2+-binding RTX toxin-like protein
MNPSQALNIGALSSAYADSFTTLNLMTGGDGWFVTGADGKPRSLTTAELDTKGWPKGLPLVNGEAETVYSNIFYTQKLPPGKYIIEWDGPGTVFAYQDGKVIGPNKIEIDYQAKYTKVEGGKTVPTDDGITVLIGNGNAQPGQQPVTNIKVYDARFADLVEYGERYNPEWFQQIDDFRVLRMHGIQDTNFSKVKDWDDRIEKADQAFWSKTGQGAPFEIQVDLANQTRSDLWITIPHLATPDFMKKAAEYIKANLDPDLKVYVEFSNEYWTTIFDQHQYFIDLGKELFPNGQFSNGQAYGVKVSEMTQIFKSVWTGKDADRLIPTITVDDIFFGTKEADTVLNTPDYVAKGGKSPLQAGVKFIATDGYFGWFPGNAYFDGLLDGWMAQGEKKAFELGREYLLELIRNDLVPNWQKGAAIAKKYGLDFGVYEGGTLLINDAGAGKPTNPKYTDFSNRFQQSAEAKQVYEYALAEWRKTGNGPFALFADIGRPGDYGDYGHWNAPDYKPEPRTTAFIEDNARDAPWLADDKRPASTFDNGTYDAGTAGADRLAGTAFADRLYGLAGADTLDGGAANDRLVGGESNDRLLGGAGTDVLDGGTGADSIDGGLGNDWLTYRFSDTAVVVELLTGKGSGGDAQGDTFSNIEFVLGSSGADRIGGSNARDQLYGGDGADQIAGRGGNDILYGGFGDDTLSGGAGNDFFIIGPGRDTVLDWTEGDKLSLIKYANPAGVTIRQSELDTIVTQPRTGDDYVIVLKNVKANTISIADDFFFV